MFCILPFVAAAGEFPSQPVVFRIQNSCGREGRVRRGFVTILQVGAAEPGENVDLGPLAAGTEGRVATGRFEGGDRFAATAAEYRRHEQLCGALDECQARISRVQFGCPVHAAQTTQAVVQEAPAIHQHVLPVQHDAKEQELDVVRFASQGIV